MPKISLRDISFQYDSHEKLYSHFNLEVANGGFLSIIGPSGAGKSTLLEIIALLIPPESGKILFDGIEKTHADCGTLSMAYVNQTNALCPWTTVLENVLLPVKCKRKVSEFDRKIATEALGAVGIGEYRYRFPNQLSGGQNQRVSLAQVLFSKPETILLDEPMAGLDFQTRILLESIFLDVFRSKTQESTKIMVTHDIETALVLSDRVICVGRTKDRTLEIVFDERIQIAGETRTPESVRESSTARQLFREVWNCLRPFAIRHQNEIGAE
jgi:NitT/TauT family transport system ATP-binding protein